MGCVAPVYRPRDAEHTVLHQVIALHLEAFLDAVAEADEGAWKSLVYELFQAAHRARDLIRTGASGPPEPAPTTPAPDSNVISFVEIVRQRRERGTAASVGEA